MTRAHTQKIKLSSPSEFRQHVAQFLALALAALILFLGIGILGYHLIVGLAWVDSLLNASMILTGMGPVDAMPDDASKIFASFYALISGAVYPVLTAVVLYPFVNRMMKILHLQAINSTADD